ncbi:hypothetical protein GCM10010140_62410 [Streptosporangium pseudovulgare]|uniref:Helix-turn-helix domain-containing protein n=1 Tax=Streptosporangium pseudovulgare TaxID=35765 RepID=A0ABQ2RC69_9ACTN|nr:hypothetical protein GCM10010140_62410 [Streptosporangium pseudovulgare]
MSEPDRLATVLPGGWVLLGPVGAGYCERALRAAARAAARDGIQAPPEVRALTQLLVIAVGTSVCGRAEVSDEADSSGLLLVGSGPVGTGTAAEHLGITDRGVRDLCARGALPAERIAGRWLIDLADLGAYAEQRSRGRQGRCQDTARIGSPRPV